MTYVTNEKHTKNFVTSNYTPGRKMYYGWPQKLQYQSIDDGIRRLFNLGRAKKINVCPFVLAFAWFRSSNFLKFSKFQLLAYF